MKTEGLKREQKYIIAFSVAVFVFSLTKYLISSEHLPERFYILELLSMTAVLLLVYYSDRQIRRLHEKISERDDEIVSLKAKNEQLDKELKEKSDLLTKDSTREAFEDIDELFSVLPPFSETNRFCNKALSVIGENCEIIIGLFFVYNKQSQNFSVEGNYGIVKDEPVTPFNIGEGLHGEALKERMPIVLEELPDEYFKGYSGLGEAKPKYIYILPVADENSAAGVLELASFKPLDITEHWEKINKKLLELING